jgi:MFS family permease
MNEGIWIPFIVFFSIFGYLALHRYLEYKETVALAEKGLIKPREPGDGKDSLRWGIVITAIGLALTVGLYPLGALVDRGGTTFPLGFGPWMLVGLLPLFFGLGLILIYLVTRPEDAAGATNSAASPAPDWPVLPAPGGGETAPPT